MKVFDDQTNGIKVGQRAENFRIDDTLWLSDLEGFPIFFVFWKSLWGRCQQEAPVIEKEIWQRFKDKGLKVFAVGVKENAEEASTWSSQHQLTYPVLTDPEGEIYKIYGNSSVPYHVIIDQRFGIIHSQEDFQKELLIGAIRDAFREPWALPW